MVWTPKAQITLANDLITATLVLDEDSQSRAAIQSIADALITAAIAADPTLAANVIAAADAAVADALAAESIVTSAPFVPEFDDDEGFLADEGGVPSRVGFDVQGEIAEATMRSAFGKGMPRVVAGAGGGARMVDALGRNFALGFDAQGQFDEITKWALVNLLHWYVGPDRPFVWPGGHVIWVRTDETGLPVETLRGRG